MRCQYCGRIIPDDSAFCPECGQRQEELSFHAESSFDSTQESKPEVCPHPEAAHETKMAASLSNTGFHSGEISDFFLPPALRRNRINVRFSLPQDIVCGSFLSSLHPQYKNCHPTRSAALPWKPPYRFPGSGSAFQVSAQRSDHIYS